MYYVTQNCIQIVSIQTFRFKPLFVLPDHHTLKHVTSHNITVNKHNIAVNKHNITVNKHKNKKGIKTNVHYPFP